MKDKDKIKAVINLINYIDDRYNIPKEELYKLNKIFKSNDIWSDIKKLIGKYQEIFQYYGISESRVYLFVYKGKQVSYI